MAFRKMISKRLFFEAQRSSIKPDSRVAISLRREKSLASNSPANAQEQGFFRRFLHRRALDHPAVKLPDFLSLPIGDKIRETLRGGEISAGDRLRRDCFIPRPNSDGESSLNLSAIDARKILRLAQMERLKSKLREISKTSISYSEFSRICVETCNNEEQGVEFAKTLDQSGNVFIFGNLVFLRPEQIAKSIESVILESIVKSDDPRKKELEELEKRKALIDLKAKKLVRGELYCGLGFILAQTLGAMRLTFWELTWDVMEPICFFATTVYFALGYGFFLRTSTEPTFQGYFQRRFVTKQKRLMELNNFDVQRYIHLRKAFNHHHGQQKDSDLLKALYDH